MKKTFLSLLASFIALLSAFLWLAPWDVWQLPVFRPYARTSRLRRWMFNGRPPGLRLPQHN